MKLGGTFLFVAMVSFGAAMAMSTFAASVPDERPVALAAR